MQRIKNAVYEHRFGLFFFVFLMIYSFVLAGDMQLWKVDDLTYSFHVVDFSIGFCTKLLPGAICKLIFGLPTRDEVSLFLTALIAVCYMFVGFLMDKALKTVKSEHRLPMIIFIMFFLTGPATFAVYVDMFCWLDFYWLFAAVLAVFCLQNVYTYILVIPLMFFAIMSHYASILCYVPFVAVFMLYKISVTVNKREKCYLCAIWWIMVVTSISLSLYMMLFEVENVNISAEDLNTFLNSLEIEDTRYYIFSLYRDKVADIMPEYYLTQESMDTVLNIDMSQSPLKILCDIIVQQMFTNKAYGSFSGDLKHYIMISPIVILVYRAFLVVFSYNKDNHLKRFAVFCSAALFIFILLAGTLFSTDTVRWLSHAFIPLFTMFMYMIIREDEDCCKQIFALFNKIPLTAVICYLAIYSVSINLI